MTQEEKTQILSEALDRAYRDLDLNRAFNSEDAYHLVRCIGDLELLCKMAGETSEPRSTGKPENQEITFTMEPRLAEEPEEAPAEPAPDETVDYKMEEVRGALAAARRKGVNVSKLIQSFGVDNFALIDKTKYPEIMQKLAEEGAV